MTPARFTPRLRVRQLFGTLNQTNEPHLSRQGDGRGNPRSRHPLRLDRGEDRGEVSKSKSVATARLRRKKESGVTLRFTKPTSMLLTALHFAP